MREQLDAATQRAEQVSAQVDRDRADAAAAIAQAQERAEQATARAGDLDRQLSTTREQLDTSHIAQARLETQLSGAERRADEANTRTERGSAHLVAQPARRRQRRVARRDHRLKPRLIHHG